MLESGFGKNAHVIQETAERGLTPALLSNIIKFAAQHCPSWTDIADPKFSTTAGQQLVMASLNLYQLNDWVIKPATTKPHWINAPDWC